MCATPGINAASVLGSWAWLGNDIDCCRCGVPVGCTEFEIRKPHDTKSNESNTSQVLGPNAVGEVWVRGPQMGNLLYSSERTSKDKEVHSTNSEDLTASKQENIEAIDAQNVHSNLIDSNGFVRLPEMGFATPAGELYLAPQVDEWVPQIINLPSVATPLTASTALRTRASAFLLPLGLPLGEDGIMERAVLVSCSELASSRGLPVRVSKAIINMAYKERSTMHTTTNNENEIN